MSELTADGSARLEAAGGRPLSDVAAAEFVARTTRRPAIDLDLVEGGAQQTVIPTDAQATLSYRLAPGQTVAAMLPRFERRIRNAAPAGAHLELSHSTCDPAAFDVNGPVLTLARSTLLETFGRAPVIRGGGSIPVAAMLSHWRIPSVLTGFARIDDNIHGIDESLRLESVEDASRAATGLLRAFSELPV